ncbi:MAG: hypothetical protein ACHQRK_05020 [Gemmatimonadales bacterium]|jgi:hypothetical protein
MTDWNAREDDPMDDRLRELARDYNRPVGEVPREAMWKAIAPTLQAARVVEIDPRRRMRRTPLLWTAALAAALVLGAVLEREASSGRPTASVAAGVRTGGHPLATETVAVTTGSPDAGAAAKRARSMGSVPTSPPRIASAVRRTEPSAPADPADARLLYRVAARQTLIQAEALLTAYRSEDQQHRDDESMQQAGRWARDVLTSTRLLLDSPAANDPQLRALFTDLELVLAQIVQLSGAPLQAGERDLIERAMRDRDLLPRLRSALPAGAAAS